MAKNKHKAELIQEVQEELGGTHAEIESVVNSQFIFIKKTLEAGHFNSVRMPYFGRFMVNPYRLRKLNIAMATNRKSKK